MAKRDLDSNDYEALSEFRYQIRRFLHFSEEAAKQEGLEPQQHQLMLAVRAAPAPDGPTIGYLADQLLVRHHSAVGLIDRLEERSLLERAKSKGDRRQVCIRLTANGESMLRKLSSAHHDELRRTAPGLVATLSKLLEGKQEDDAQD